MTYKVLIFLWIEKIKGLFSKYFSYYLKKVIYFQCIKLIHILLSDTIGLPYTLHTINYTSNGAALKNKRKSSQHRLMATTVLFISRPKSHRIHLLAKLFKVLQVLLHSFNFNSQRTVVIK